MEPEGSLPVLILLFFLLLKVNILENKAFDGQLTFIPIPEYSSPCSSTDIMFTTYNVYGNSYKSIASSSEIDLTPYMHSHISVLTINMNFVQNSAANGVYMEPVDMIAELKQVALTNNSREGVHFMAAHRLSTV
jgi:hypothetical protein